MKDKGWETVSYLIFVRWMAFFMFYVRCYDFLSVYVKSNCDSRWKCENLNMMVLLRNYHLLSFMCYLSPIIVALI